MIKPTCCDVTFSDKNGSFWPKADEIFERFKDDPYNSKIYSIGTMSDAVVFHFPDIANCTPENLATIVEDLKPYLTLE